MNLDFKLDFLYYQEQQILDGKDPKMDELRPHIFKFKEYMGAAPLENIIQLILHAHEEKYPQPKYWYTKLLVPNSSSIEVTYPSDLDEESDLYLSPKEMTRDDLSHLILRQFDDVANNSFLLKELELAFEEPQDYPALVQTIEGSLEGLTFVKDETLEETVFTVEDSPIANVRITPNTFVLGINQDTWIRYLG